MNKIIIIFLIFCACKDEPQPKIEQSYFIGSWESKDSTKNKYIFSQGDSGKVYFNGNWNNLTWKESNQMLELTWFGRTNKYWIFDKGSDSFNLCFIDRNCTAYFRK